MSQFITYTFCESGENHVGNQIVGQTATSGFEIDDIKTFHKSAVEEKKEVEFYHLNEGIYEVEGENVAISSPEKGCILDDAYLLIVRDFVDNQEEVFDKLKKLKWDTKYYDGRRKRVLNKHARSNNIIASFSQEANYEEGKGTVIDVATVPEVGEIMKKLEKMGGEKFASLVAEGNNYKSNKRNGIGYHGDAERKKVAGIRFGKDRVSNPIHFQWYHRHKRVGKNMKFDLFPGDLYIMSEKSVGTDWKRSSLFTLRHATGSAKYTK